MGDEVAVKEKDNVVKSPMDLLFSEYGLASEQGDKGDGKVVDFGKDDKVDDTGSEDDRNKDEEPKGGDTSEPKVKDTEEPVADTGKSPDDFDSVLSTLEEFVEKGSKEVTLNSDMIAKIKDIGAKAQEAETLKTELNKVRGQLDEGSSDLKSFVEAFRKDPVKALSEYSESLNLPDPQVVTTMLSSGSVEDQLKVWQENVLIKDIEKEFNLQSGEFEIDKEELWTPKTPSYKWRIETERKERELSQRLADTATQTAKQRDALTQRQQEDRQWIKDTYFKDDEGTFNELVQKAMSVPEKVFKGELPPEKSPFEYRNLIRGMFFDEFAKIEIAKAVEDLKGQYQKLGYSLPEHDSPTDLSKLKGREQKKEEDDGTKAFSPLHSMMKKYSN